MNKKLKELENKADAAPKAFITADALYDNAAAYLDTANKANRAIAAYRTGDIK